MSLNKPTEITGNMLDQASQSAEQVIKSTQKAANEALQSLSKSLHDLRDQATPLVERTVNQASSLTHQGLDSLHESTHQLRVKAEHAQDNTVSYIKHEPMKSVLIAAATGAALMALISMVSHSRHRD